MDMSSNGVKAIGIASGGATEVQGSCPTKFFESDLETKTFFDYDCKRV